MCAPICQGSKTQNCLHVCIPLDTNSFNTCLTIFSPRLTARLRPGKAMMSMWLITISAKSTVGTSSNEMVTAPKQGIVSTRGFKVILALAFSYKQKKPCSKITDC